MPNSTQEKPLNARQLGAFLAAVGLAFVIVGLIFPALDAKVPSYWPEAPLAIFGPVALMMGSIFVLKGEAAHRKFGHPSRPASWPLWLVFASAAVGAVIFSWLRTRYGA